MNFQQKYRPVFTGDLIFRDADTRQTIEDYASGIRKQHLLLDGPTSSGKSEAARLILKARLFDAMGEAYQSIYHGQGFDARTVKQIANDWNFQMMMCGEAFSVIDEVDFANADGRREIRKLIDNSSYGTLICTTNFAHKLEPAFVSRFHVVTLEVPVNSDWFARAKYIFAQEGFKLSDAQVERIMANFTGHARDFMAFMENVCLRLRRTMEARIESKPQLHIQVTPPVSTQANGIRLDGAVRQASTNPSSPNAQ